MRIRGAVGLLCLVALLLHCSKYTIHRSPEKTPPETEPPVVSSVPAESPAAQKLKEENVPEIVRILREMNEDAQECIRNNDLLEAHQMFEDALDLMTLYEEEYQEEFPEEAFPPEFLAIRNTINSDYKELLQRENTDLHETALEILLEDINISEKSPEDSAPAPASTGSVTEFPLEMNSQVLQAVSYFENRERGRKTFEVWLQRAGKYLPMIYDIFEEEGLPKELAYLAMIESGFRPTITSRARAVGMWQFISATGRAYGLRIDDFVDERRDPVKSTRAAARHLKDLYEHWDNNWLVALAAYNVSERRIQREIRRYKTTDFWKMRSLPRQTRSYVPTFIAAATIAGNPEKYGFESPVIQAWVYDDVPVTRQASIDVIAKAAGISEQKVIELNPELRNWITPNRAYSVRLPKGTEETFVKNFTALPDDQLITKLIHTVRRGETLSYIARKYRSSVTQIMRVNNIRNTRTLQIGRKLVIPLKPKSFTYIEPSIIAGASASRVVPVDADQRTKITYRVRKGDTVSEIAEAHHVGLSKVLAWNGLGRRSIIRPGQRLTIWLRPSSGEIAPHVEAAPVAASGGQNEITYTVRRGDTVSEISQLYDVPVYKIFQWNNLSQRSTIYPGDKIIIYADDVETAGSAAESAANLFKYTVRRGDNLWDIARRFSTTVGSLKKINNIHSSRIYPGDVLLIPAQQN